MNLAVLLPFRMAPLDQVAQDGHAGPDVDGGGVQIVVPEQRLDGTQVHAAVLQMRCEGVAKNVRCHQGKICCRAMPLHQCQQMGVAHAYQWRRVHEDGICRLVAPRPSQQLLPCSAEVLIQPVPRVLTVDHYAFARSLASHVDGVLFSLDLVHPQPDQLRGAHAGGVEQLEHCPVPQADGCAGVRREHHAQHLPLRRGVWA